jgi:nicotinamidase-related amidase
MPPAPRRALIVIDVQNEYVSGRLPIEYPPLSESLPAIAAAMDAATAAGVPVVVVQQDAPGDSPIFAVGSAGWQLHEVVASRPHDHLVRKALPSAFAGTDLADWLAEREVDTLTVCGFMTHNCDASTILHAMHAGWSVEWLSDASGALPYATQAGRATAEEIHRVFAVVFHTRFAAVTRTADWIAALQAGQALTRGSILSANLRARGLA